MTGEGETLKLKKVFIGDRVYREIKRMLLDKIIAPGERIEKAELCIQLGVSPTPVNEAVKRLVGEELIEIREKDGFYARKYSPQDLIDFHEVRAAIEGMAIRLCIEKQTDDLLEEMTHYYDHFTFPLSPEEKSRYAEADKRFHERLILESGNIVFIKFVQSFNLMTSSYQMGLMRPPASTIVEHQEIIQAIRSRSSELAQNLIIAHHLRSRDEFIRKIQLGLLEDDGDTVIALS